MSAETDYTYQLNAYFGIFYPENLIATVLDLCKSNPRFSSLGDDEAEVTIGKSLLFASTNSDIDGECTTGFIAADDMTFGGPDHENPEDTVLRLEPSEMTKREEKNKSAVNSLTDLYDYLVKEFKRLKVPLTNIYLGWQVLSCAWDLDDTASTEATGSASSEKVPQPAKKAPAKKPIAKKKAEAPVETVQQPTAAPQPTGRARKGAAKK